MGKIVLCVCAYDFVPFSPPGREKERGGGGIFTAASYDYCFSSSSSFRSLFPLTVTSPLLPIFFLLICCKFPFPPSFHPPSQRGRNSAVSSSSLFPSKRSQPNTHSFTHSLHFPPRNRHKTEGGGMPFIAIYTGRRRGKITRFCHLSSDIVKKAAAAIYSWKSCCWKGNNCPGGAFSRRRIGRQESCNC